MIIPLLTVDLPRLIAGAEIPAEHSCRGQDTSPAVVWSEPPVGTAAFAVVVDDPDAPGGTFVHWVAYNLPASARGLPKDVAPRDPAVPQGNIVEVVAPHVHHRFVVVKELVAG